MVRTQIQLTAEQHRALKQWARQRHISLSEAIRRFVSDRLAAERAAPSRAALVKAALAAAGEYRDPEGLDNVAREHDAHLENAFRS
jgi:hypothetical protein